MALPFSNSRPPLVTDEPIEAPKMALPFSNSRPPLVTDEPLEAPGDGYLTAIPDNNLAKRMVDDQCVRPDDGGNVLIQS